MNLDDRLLAAIRRECQVLENGSAVGNSASQNTSHDALTS
jgi:hypothetical protein